MQRYPKEHLAFARGLRREMTNAEAMLWQSLRGGSLDGFKFRRQVPIGSYVVDFLCVQKKLIVELDGVSHESEDKKARDADRDAWLRNKGYRILRFSNELVIGGGNLVLDGIAAALKEPSSDPC